MKHESDMKALHELKNENFDAIAVCRDLALPAGLAFCAKDLVGFSRLIRFNWARCLMFAWAV